MTAPFAASTAAAPAAPGPPGPLPEAEASSICARLSTDPDLPLPSSLYRGGGEPGTTAVHAYLSALLRRDPASFLERYGPAHEYNRI